MDNTLIINILNQIAGGKISPEHAMPMLKQAMHRENSPGITPDLDREERTGIREVIFGPGKSVQQIINSAKELGKGNKPVLATKVPPEYETELKKAFPQNGYFDSGSGIFALNFDPGLAPPWPGTGDILLLTAGSADLPVALECLASCRFLDIEAGLICDVGVAGLHRVFEHMETIKTSKALIVIAGMDGALPSVVAGLCPQPVIGVPTSVGYGVSFEGVSALLNMLNSCAPGIAAVNIDNGFGAGCIAQKILNTR